MVNGQPLIEVVRQLGISDETYYKWRKGYGGLQVDQAKRDKELEQEEPTVAEGCSGSDNR
jgi:transposase-like protein